MASLKGTIPTDGLLGAPTVTVLIVIVVPLLAAVAPAGAARARIAQTADMARQSFVGRGFIVAAQFAGRRHSPASLTVTSLTESRAGSENGLPSRSQRPPRRQPWAPHLPPARRSQGATAALRHRPARQGPARPAGRRSSTARRSHPRARRPR